MDKFRVGEVGGCMHAFVGFLEPIHFLEVTFYHKAFSLA